MKQSLPKTEARVFTLLTNFNSRVIRLLLNVNIGVGLLALVGLAACVALLLAAVGIRGLAASKESLRSVYENHMPSVQQLTEIANLMLNNRRLMQAALSVVSIGAGADRHDELVMDREVAAMAANAIATNIETINSLWHAFASSPLIPAERTLANQVDDNRGAFVSQVLRPAVIALRATQYTETKMLSARADALYEQARIDLRALVQLEFEGAHDARPHGQQVTGIHACTRSEADQRACSGGKRR